MNSSRIRPMLCGGAPRRHSGTHQPQQTVSRARDRLEARKKSPRDALLNVSQPFDSLPMEGQPR